MSLLVFNTDDYPRLTVRIHAKIGEVDKWYLLKVSSKYPPFFIADMLSMCDSQMGALLIIEGVYSSMSLINEFIPQYSMKPLARGMCNDTDNHFGLFDWPNPSTDGSIPSPSALALAIFELQNHSLLKSPGLFGFDMTTHNGKYPQVASWTDTWEEFFTMDMQRMLLVERTSRRRINQDLDKLIESFLAKVIPRLLRPLVMGFTRISPVLVHGNLHYDNIAVQCGSKDDPLIYNPSAFWGHHECKFDRKERYRPYYQPRCIPPFLNLSLPFSPISF